GPPDHRRDGRRPPPVRSGQTILRLTPSSFGGPSTPVILRRARNALDRRTHRHLPPACRTGRVVVTGSSASGTCFGEGEEAPDQPCITDVLQCIRGDIAFGLQHPCHPRRTPSGVREGGPVTDAGSGLSAP